MAIEANSEKKKKLLTVLFCLGAAFICITINSKNSFLYKFQDFVDSQCFMTVAKCMLRGDVLYKDVYEHKGPILYFIYCIGDILTNKSFIGVYLIEIVLFSIYLLFTFKILRLYCENYLVIFFMTALIAICSSSVYEIRGGGQCEELSIPFFAISIYYALLICKANEKKTQYKYSTIIGFCFAMVFWMKYTLTGMYIGFALCILILGIKNKDVKYVLYHALSFLLGTFIGSLPVIIYFTINGGFADLWNVYFYTLIFMYSKVQNTVQKSFTENVLQFVNIWTVLIVLSVTWGTKEFLNNDSRLMCILLFVMEIVGNSFGKVFIYTYESIRAFYVLGCIGIIGLCKDAYSKEWSSGRIKLFADRVASEWDEKIKPKFNSSKNRLLAAVFCVAYFMLIVYISSPAKQFISYDLEDYEQYKAYQKMMELQPDNPVILCFSCMDPGFYYLTDTYPIDKYFCWYNMYSPDDLGYYEKYITTGKADFVIAERDQTKLLQYGYEEIIKEKGVACVSDKEKLVLIVYARSDLLD